MDWNSFFSSQKWSAVGALGQWFGALATFAAVVVALKQASDASTVKVKVHVAPAIPFVGGRFGPTLVMVSATNVGHRTVKLTATGVLLPDDKQMVFPHHSQHALPATLEESEQTQFPVEVHEIAESLYDRGYRGRIDLRFYFSDSREVRHWYTWKQFDIAEWLKAEV